MIQYNYLYKVKYSNLRENLTLREKLLKQKLNLRVNTCPMVINEFKKFLKQHDIKYSFYRNMPNTVVVNTSNFPRLVFEFDDMDYCRIITIPPGKQDYNFLVHGVKELLVKMLNFNLIDIHSLKRLYKYGTEKEKRMRKNKNGDKENVA